jgi:O-antigen ligase
MGPGVFHLAEVEEVDDEQHRILTAPDSHYVRLLFEQGLLGTGGFVLLLIAILGKCGRAIRDATGSERMVMVSSLASVAGFVFANNTVSMFTLLPLALLFWMSVAVAASRVFSNVEAAPPRAVRLISRCAKSVQT